MPPHRKSSLWLSILIILALFIPSASPVLAKPASQETPPPETVTIPGTIQSKVGCPGDWQPDCDKTFLTYDQEDDVWQAAFDLPAGSYEYKVAINKSWSENYGLKATPSGPNIPLSLAADEKVKFYYDHKTHWVTDSHNSVIAVATGTFQSELGCAKNNDPGCLRSWLEDPEASGVYSTVTKNLPPGDYEVFVAINESMNQTYGQDGAPGGKPYPFTVPEGGAEVYFGFDPATGKLLVSTEGAPRGTLAKAQAFWVNRDSILWNVVGTPRYTYTLHYDPTGAMKLEVSGITGGKEIPLIFNSGGPGEASIKKFPQLTGFSTLKIPPEYQNLVPEILKGQIAVTSRDENGKLVDATSTQIPGALDDLFTYQGPLGVTYESHKPVLRLWAPTARSVKLLLYEPPISLEGYESHDLQVDPATGVWTITGDASWTGRYYLYEVEVYVPGEGKVMHNRVTDPYSISLSTNSKFSQIVDLSSPDLMPAGWQNDRSPYPARPEDIVIYELHVRDFSIYDQSVPAEHRGKFLAFTDLESNGMQHLKALAEAGLTHIHLLPVFDVASIEEDPAQRQEPDPAVLASYPGDSQEQQKLIAQTRDQDGFNWGYDPYHYTTPEGSYSTNPDDSTRIVEFRHMVEALHSIGLNVVMDVVYNHTNASGQSEKSVLDKVVPGYYHRLNSIGAVETSTCCQNTATEHTMMEKLMIDSLLTWARAYHIDGFRFDLMGHHMLQNMVNVRQALDGLNPSKDGVDGRKIYIYGEGWDFGEVAGNARGVNATQLNIGGTGIGVFNDRLRDGARGGNPFSSPQEQGFLTGLFWAPNASEQRSSDDQKARLFDYMDWIRLGLAGNLKDYPLVKRDGETILGEKYQYGSAPAAYTLDPQENIVYVSAHDNETLFDAVQMKAPASATLADRIRMHNLGVNLVMLSQGVPFFHAGDELLRSKSLDRNSYNSGDWFNRLDFTYTTNNWAVGLPPGQESLWPVMQPLLADPNLKPGKDQILQALANFTEMLRIRQSSTLFRLGTDAQVQSHLSFLNTGPEQIPGVIVMMLKDDGIPDLDPNAEQILVIFNASPEVQTFTSQDFAGREFKLHPIQTASQDPIVRTASFDGASGTFTVPGRTAAVFVAQTMPQAPQTKNSLAIAGLAVLVALWIGLGFSVLGRKGPDEANLE